MEGQQFLQRPGGLGPMAARVKPLGSLASEIPGLYTNTPEAIDLRRSSSLDNINRVSSQYQRDRGEYVRSAVGPTNYQEGNIMPSSEITGLPGYNHRDSLVMPERAADMSKAQYLVDTSNSMDPNLRAQMQILTSLPQQNFLNAPDPSAALMSMDFRTPGSMPLQLPAKGDKK